MEELWEAADDSERLQRLAFQIQERDLKLPPDWLVLEVPSDTSGEAPTAVYQSPRGARFESYDTALHFIATRNQSTSAPVIFDPAKTTLHGDADEAR